MSIVIMGMSELHASFYQKTEALLERLVFLKITDFEFITKFKPVYVGYLQRLRDRNYDFISDNEIAMLYRFLFMLTLTEQLTTSVDVPALYCLLINLFNHCSGIVL